MRPFRVLRILMGVIILFILLIYAYHELHQQETTPDQAMAQYLLPEQVARAATSIERDIDINTLTVELPEEKFINLHEQLIANGWVYQVSGGCYTSIAVNHSRTVHLELHADQDEIIIYYEEQ